VALRRTANHVDHDPETGEVTEQSNSAASAATGEKSGDASEAGQADPSAQGPDKASPANNSASSQKGGGAIPSDASGQAASEIRQSSKTTDKEAAKAGDKTATPTNEKEYVAYAEAWIAEWTGADQPTIKNPRWQADKNIRNKCNVTEEVRDAMLGRFIDKVNDNADADRS